MPIYKSVRLCERLKFFTKSKLETSNHSKAKDIAIIVLLLSLKQRLVTVVSALVAFEMSKKVRILWVLLVWGKVFSEQLISHYGMCVHLGV